MPGEVGAIAAGASGSCVRRSGEPVPDILQQGDQDASTPTTPREETVLTLNPLMNCRDQIPGIVGCLTFSEVARTRRVSRQFNVPLSTVPQFASFRSQVVVALWSVSAGSQGLSDDSVARAAEVIFRIAANDLEPPMPLAVGQSHPRKTLRDLIAHGDVAAVRWGMRQLFALSGVLFRESQVVGWVLATRRGLPPLVQFCSAPAGTLESAEQRWYEAIAACAEEIRANLPEHVQQRLLSTTEGQNLVAYARSKGNAVAAAHVILGLSRAPGPLPDWVTPNLVDDVIRDLKPYRRRSPDWISALIRELDSVS